MRRHALPLPTRLVFSYPINDSALFSVRNRITDALLDLNLPSLRLAALLHYIEQAADVNSPHFSTTACNSLLTIEWAAIIADWASLIVYMDDHVVSTSFVTAVHALYMTGRMLQQPDDVLCVLKEAYVHVAQAAMSEWDKTDA
jgi:hypothetical protein